MLSTSCSSYIGSPVSGPSRAPRRASRSLPLDAGGAAARQDRVHGGAHLAARRQRAATCRDARPTSAGRRWPTAISQETQRSIASAASWMARPSASALPANMVAEMTRNVVSVMSRSIAPRRPGGARASAATCTSASCAMAGTSAAMIGGAEQRRGRAPLPAPARRPGRSECRRRASCRTRASRAATSGTRAASSSSKRSISAGSVT